MSARRRSERASSRRALGQNFLVDRRLIREFIGTLDLRPGELVVDLGAGSGALTHALVDAGAHVWAIERDPSWAARLRADVAGSGTPHAVRVIEADLRDLRLPRRPFRVVANPPFGLTTEILGKLLDAPDRGPFRADLVLQRDVAVKHCRRPPPTLRAAAWAPWWEFELGLPIDRRSFRPRPRVDASVLTITRRDPPVLPTWLGPRLRELLRPAWAG